MSDIPEPEARRAAKAAEADVDAEVGAPLTGGGSPSEPGPSARDEWKRSLLVNALQEAQFARESWVASHEAMKEASKRLAKERKEIQQKQKAAERHKRRVRQKCQSIPTEELMLELEYRSELKAKCVEKAEALSEPSHAGGAGTQ